MQLVDGWQDCGQGLQPRGKVQVGWGTEKEGGVPEALGAEVCLGGQGEWRWVWLTRTPEGGRGDLRVRSGSLRTWEP